MAETLVAACRGKLRDSRVAAGSEAPFRGIAHQFSSANSNERDREIWKMGSSMRNGRHSGVPPVVRC